MKIEKNNNNFNEDKVKESLQEICDSFNYELSCCNGYECQNKCSIQLLAKELGIDMKFIDYFKRLDKKNKENNK